eukprot:6193786-Pleurochrysis_carterae.AAC.6
MPFYHRKITSRVYVFSPSLKFTSKIILARDDNGHPFGTKTRTLSDTDTSNCRPYFVLQTQSCCRSQVVCKKLLHQERSAKRIVPWKFLCTARKLIFMMVACIHISGFDAHAAHTAHASHLPWKCSIKRTLRPAGLASCRIANKLLVSRSCKPASHTLRDFAKQFVVP